MQLLAPLRTSFLSTPSVGRATSFFYQPQRGRLISIHALRGEGDGGRPPDLKEANHISIHALRGEGDVVAEMQDELKSNFYPRPPWGGRQAVLWRVPAPSLISIHALRGEGDIPSLASICQEEKISIHALRGEGDPPLREAPGALKNFYPRPPWGGRLPRPRLLKVPCSNFYPRPPWGGRQR